MAEERLLPNGDDAGWTSGGWADVDEGIASFDDDTTKVVSGTTATPVAEGATLNLDFAPRITVVDADTVTRVAFDIRATSDLISTGSDLTAQLVIGGTPQGAAVALGLTASWATFSDVNDVGWNSDWTEAQLNGAQVRFITTQSGKPTSDVWEVSTVDLVITYTPAAGGGLSIPVAFNHYAKMRSG